MFQARLTAGVNIWLSSRRYGYHAIEKPRSSEMRHSGSVYSDVDEFHFRGPRDSRA